MKKLILLALLSFPSLAIDLNKDGVYFCTESASRQINSNKGSVSKEQRFTVKVKDSIVTLSKEGDADISWAEFATSVFATKLTAVDENNRFTLLVDASSKAPTFFLSRFFFSKGKEEFALKNAVQIISQGTCVLF